MMDRREFVGGAAALLAALGWEGCMSARTVGKRLPDWQPGELDLHFIYTGCGENMFYRLPDGTSVLNDTGDFYRPKNVDEVPLLPSPDRVGGEWVSRYIRRVYPEKAIDYAVFSHWHADHIGHNCFGREDSPDAAWRYRTTADGRRIDGFLCVAEDFDIRRCMVHDFELGNRGKSADAAIDLMRDWLPDARRRGLKFEPFKVGALDQIALTRDPAAYKGLFSVRNLCANGVIWNGTNGTVDFAGEHLKATGKKRFDQNMLSLGFVMRYGKFRYFAAGDFGYDRLKRADGREMRMDGFLGRLAGHVQVAKMSHHGCGNAISDEFAKAVQADAYVSCMWCPAQSWSATLDRIVAAGTPSGAKPLIVPQLICDRFQGKWARERGWKFQDAVASHVVVRVAPGGGSYCVYLLDTADEGMRVTAAFEKEC